MALNYRETLIYDVFFVIKIKTNVNVLKIYRNVVHVNYK